MLHQIRCGQLPLVEQDGWLVSAPSHPQTEFAASILRVLQPEARMAHEFARADFAKVATYLQAHGLKVARREEPISPEMMAMLRRWRRDSRLQETISQLRDEVKAAGRLRRSAQRPTPPMVRLADQIAASQSLAEQHGR